MTILSIATSPDSVIDNKPFSELQLGDYGDTCMIDPNADPLQGHVIGAAIFRSPEAILNLRWKALTDI